MEKAWIHSLLSLWRCNQFYLRPMSTMWCRMVLEMISFSMSLFTQRLKTITNNMTILCKMQIEMKAKQKIKRKKMSAKSKRYLTIVNCWDHTEIHLHVIQVKAVITKTCLYLICAETLFYFCFLFFASLSFHLIQIEAYRFANKINDIIYCGPVHDVH